MGVVFITAKPRFMPDSSDLGTWEPMPKAEGFYMQTVGEFHLFAHECLDESAANTWNQKKKHATIASWLKTVLAYAEEHWGAIDKDSLYVIPHDKDLLKARKTDEGIYKEQRVAEVGGGFEGMVKDGNIYLFQHVAVQDMCVALINDLIEPTIENVEQAIEVIKNCTYEI